MTAAHLRLVREREPEAPLDEHDRRNVVRWLRRAAELGRPVVISPRLARALAAIADDQRGAP